jgi:hypothetical protein
MHIYMYACTMYHVFIILNSRIISVYIYIYIYEVKFISSFDLMVRV